MSTGREKPRVGELRPSQILTTFGIGSIIDLPHISVMVMGLEDWPNSDYREITEERLLASVRSTLGGQVNALRSPPIVPDTDRLNPFEEQSYVGVPVAPFPRWMLCPRCRRLAPLSSNQFKLKPDPYRPDRVRYVHANCRYPASCPPPCPPASSSPARTGTSTTSRGSTSSTVVPRPSLQAPTPGDGCVRGGGRHLRPLRDLRQVPPDVRRLQAPQQRPSGVSGTTTPLAGFRRGGCKDELNQPIRVRALFRVRRTPGSRSCCRLCRSPKARTCSSSLSPTTGANSTTWRGKRTSPRCVVGTSCGTSPGCPTPNSGRRSRRSRLKAETATGSDVDDLKTPEWLVFIDPAHAQRTRDFRLREVRSPRRFAKYFEKVVLAERLREVRALVGFTRIESPGDYENPAEFPEAQRMKIARGNPSWVPANEIRGEGIFFQFSETEIQNWLGRVQRLHVEFFNAHKQWRKDRGLQPPEDFYPGLRYVLLHSFAHALIRQLSLECGYTAASLRERIYSRNPGTDRPEMAGVLIYTAAPDSEGTLGGLVSLGEPGILERHLNQAMDCMRLCSSDPLCAEHHPGKEGTSLHGASCHACLFAPETSCERGNKYLDRTVLVPTVDRDEFAFFLDLESDAAGASGC